MLLVYNEFIFLFIDLSTPAEAASSFTKEFCGSENVQKSSTSETQSESFRTILPNKLDASLLGKTILT